MFFYQIKNVHILCTFPLELVFLFYSISYIYYISFIERSDLYATKENLSDAIRLLAGFLLSLKLLFTSFGINFITNDQIDAIVNVISFLFILYFGYKNNYVGKKESNKRKYSRSTTSIKKGTFRTGSFFIIAAPQLHLFAMGHMRLLYVEMCM